MKKEILSLTFILLCGQFIFAQESKTMGLSLEECVKMAVEKNINVKTARIDAEKDKYRKDEVSAALYPKIDFKGSITDNIVLPTTVLPGEIIGQPGTSFAAQMGSQYSTSAVLNITQVLYNQTAITALKLSKTVSKANNLSIEKASEEIAFDVAKMYALALTTAEQRKLIDENISRTERLKNISQLIVQTGIGKQVDLDRVNVNLENLYTQQSNTQAAQEQQLNMIKYMLNIPLVQAINLTDTAGMPILKNEPVLLSDFSNHINIRLLESQKDITLLNKKIIDNGYLPTLALSGQAAVQGLRDDFSTYFKSGPSNEWFPFANFTVSLSIPIFDGLEKRSKSRQAALDYSKIQNRLADTKESYNMSYKIALNNYVNNKNNVRRQKQNLELANKVYKETSLKYNQGLETLSSLLQDEMSLSSAQGGYLTALYNYKEAELKIMSINGEIKNLFNK